MVTPQALRGEPKLCAQHVCCYFRQQLKFSRFYGAEPPACIRRHPLAIESDTGPFVSIILYPFYAPVNRFTGPFYTPPAAARPRRAAHILGHGTLRCGEMRKFHHSVRPHKISMLTPNRSASFHRHESVGSMRPPSHLLTHCWVTPTASASFPCESPRSKRICLRFSENFCSTKKVYNYSCEFLDIQQ